MKPTLVLLFGATFAMGMGMSRPAAAQEAVIAAAIGEDSFDASAVANLQGHGYELSHGLIMHGALGLEGGASDNVFYTTSTEGRTASGMMRVAGSMHFATDRTPDDGADPDNTGGPSPRTYEFHGGFRAGYEEYLTGNDTVRSQRNLNLDALGEMTVFPAGSVAFLVKELFARDVRSANYENTQTISRDDNRLYLGLRLQPQGQTLSATLHYENWVELFEDPNESTFANRMNHTVGIEAAWQVFPVTKLLADFSYGFFGPLGTSTLNGMPYKTASQPLRATIGISTLLSALTTLKAHAGYTQASYGIGEGYAAPLGGVELGYRWAPTGRILATYDYDHFDSFNANFIADHLFALKAVQQFGTFVLDAGPELRLRHFGGIPKQIGAPDRDDVVVAVQARLQVLLAERFALYAVYRFATVQTNYRSTGSGGGDDPSFVRNDAMVGVRVTY